MINAVISNRQKGNRKLISLFESGLQGFLTHDKMPTSLLTP